MLILLNLSCDLFLPKINYYGMITQTTGEDWVDTKISLSTAVPSVGGNVPELDTVNVRVKEPVHVEHRGAKYLFFSRSYPKPNFFS